MPNERKKTYRKAPPKRGPGKAPWIIGAACLLAAAGAIAFFALRGPGAQAPSSSGPASSSLPPVSASAPPSLPPASSLPPPSSLPEPVDPGPSFQLTEEEVARLNGMLASWAAQQPEDVEDPAYGHNVSVYFLDIESGAEYVFGGDTKYLIASLNKAPYALYLYQLAEQGRCDLEEIFHVTRESIAGTEQNTGKIKEDPDLPRDYTMNELIYNLLRYSDTAALKVLLERYGPEEYSAWAAGLGLHHPDDVRKVTNGRITAVDAGVYLKALYEYMDTGLYGGELKEHLLNTRNLMIRSSHPVARKYGWDVSSLHDMAVVYAEHPYLLAILTDKSNGSKDEQAMFATITAAFEEIMNAKWAEYAQNNPG